MATLDLPQGRNGRILAVLISLLLVAVLWRAIAAPLFGWYDDRREALEHRQALAARMALLVHRLPALRQRADELAASGQAGTSALIGGSSDAVASAAIQEKVSAMAGALGLSLSSTETLTAMREGAYRRVGVRVSLDAPFPVVIQLMQSIETAQPDMLLDDLQVHGTRLLGQAENQPLNVAFTVLGFRKLDASQSGSDNPASDTSAGSSGPASDP